MTAVQSAELAARLSSLADIVTPQPMPWWPPAPGMVALLALAAVALAWIAWRGYCRWRALAYRRIALRRLAALREELAEPARRGAALIELAALARRVALHVVPRERVAALSGEDWLAFLDSGVGGDAFRSATGRLLVSVPYQRPEVVARIPRDELVALCVLIERWLRSLGAPREAGKQ